MTFIEDIHQTLNHVQDPCPSAFRTSISKNSQFYDTPFFDGNPQFGDKTEIDQVVCIGSDTDCYHQSSVNYVAQGMYGASAGEPLFVSKLAAHVWNFVAYGHLANEEELYWIEKGHDVYNKREEKKKSGQSIKKTLQTTPLME
jgi:hypothetical protein